VVFAILVGFITDGVQTFMTGLALGRTKVTETNHTLFLGWNEATIRVIIQSSLLRRQYQTLNEEKFYSLFLYFPTIFSACWACWSAPPHPWAHTELPLSWSS